MGEENNKVFSEQMWDNWVDTGKKKSKSLLSSLNKTKSRWINDLSALQVVHFCSPCTDNHLILFSVFLNIWHSLPILTLSWWLCFPFHWKTEELGRELPHASYQYISLPPTYVAFPPLSSGLCFLLSELLYWDTGPHSLSYR